MADVGKRALSARLVARQTSALITSRWQRWKGHFPEERLSAFVFDAVLSASIERHPSRDPVSGRWIGIDDAHDLGRPVTATAISHSMGLPHTTVRRQATELTDAGVLARDHTGFRVAEPVFADGRIGRFAAEDAADLMRCLHALAQANYPPAVAAIDADLAAVPAGVVARHLVAFALRAMETFTDLYGDVPTGTIMAGIIVVNIRHITEDPQLAQRYAGETVPPPDEVRRPVALRALARELGMPFETVRRRVGGLVADGRVRWREDGVIVPTSVLLSDKFLENNRRLNLHFDQMLATLAALAGGAHR